MAQASNSPLPSNPPTSSAASLNLKSALPTGRQAFHIFTDRNGVPQNSINAMAFDHRGYLWVGTQDGGAFYNGRTWSSVDMPNRTLSNSVRALCTGLDDSLWFGTDGGGVVHLKDGHWSTFTTDTRALPSNQVRCLLTTRSSKGTPILWVGTREGLACYEDGRWSLFHRQAGFPSNLIVSLLPTVQPDGKPALWVGTYGGGLIRLEETDPAKAGNRPHLSTGSSTYQWAVYDRQSSPLPDDTVFSLLETTSTTNQPTLWVGTSKGLARLTNGQWTVFDLISNGLSNDVVLSLVETVDPGGVPTLWVGTDGGGLASLEQGRWAIFNAQSGLPNNRILCLQKMVSPTGPRTLWIGTDGGGLARLEFGQWVTFDTTTGIPDPVVTSLLESKNESGEPTYWIGTDAGLAYWEKNRWTTYSTQTKALPDDGVITLLETTQPGGRRTLWVGTGGGLARFEQGRWTTFDTGSGLPNDTVWSLLETTSPEGTPILWVGTAGGGLARFEQGQWATVEGLPNNLVTSLLETRSPDGAKTLWVGTAGGGLAQYVHGQWKTFDTSSGLPNNTVWSLREITESSGDKVLWIGTDSGVARLRLANPGGGWVKLQNDLEQSTLSGTIHQICQDNLNRIYLSTNKGIARLSKATVQSVEFNLKTYTTEDGLPTNECNFGALIKDHLGRIWAGTVSGAVVFDPAQETEDTTQKPLFIERMQAGDQKYLFPQPDPIPNNSLAYDQNNFVFEYSLLSFAHEGNTRYRTQLIGYDRQVSEWTSNPQKEYTNLGHGSYTFQVWGKDYAGNATGPQVIRFTIRPAPWNTWWAYLVYVGMLCGVGYGGVRLRFKVLHHQNLLLEQKITERTLELDQTNAELAENLNHLKKAKQETEYKNLELDLKNAELAENLDQLSQAKKEVEQKNEELARKNLELIESQRQANLIFSALADVLPGTILDRKYRLEEKIGTGGFGAVYRATQLNLGRSVAVKVFRPVPGNESLENLERFRLEGVSACRVNHPNAVLILDSGVSPEGIAYLVMELLQGHSLTKELKNKYRLSLRRCAEIIIPVCNVLAEAHRAGIIHRDIKPDNIFLHQSEEGEVVKVVDFGIAKFIGEQDAMQANTLTEAGTVIGTPTYMAPERLGCNPYDWKSDVYSVGVMLFEMLAGQLPFVPDKEGLLNLALKHMTQAPPSLCRLNPEIPTDVEAVVEQALLKNPQSRPTAKELAHSFAAAVCNHLTEDSSFEGSFDVSVLLSSNPNLRLNRTLTEESPFNPRDQVTEKHYAPEQTPQGNLAATLRVDGPTQKMADEFTMISEETTGESK
ncbi:MAG: protein kinase [Acidobacteria bacterium]|nr:protein kinase [Acidobacteriota bacterium]